LILFFIDSLSLSPVSRAKNANDPASICEPNRHDAIPDPAQAVVPLFSLAMLLVGQNHTAGIGKGILGIAKAHTMLLSVERVLVRIPLKPRCIHDGRFYVPKGMLAIQ
jgi:hypothetical protein